MRKHKVWMLRVNTAVTLILVNCKAFEELYSAHPTVNSKASVFSSMFSMHIYVRLACFCWYSLFFFLLLYIYTHTYYTNTWQHYPKIRMQIESQSSAQLNLSWVLYIFISVFPSCREFSHWKVNSLATEKRDFFKAPLPLSPEFLRNLRLLGRRPTLQQIHENLIKKYGTHFLVSATLGGKLSAREIASNVWIPILWQVLSVRVMILSSIRK